MKEYGEKTIAVGVKAVNEEAQQVETPIYDLTGRKTGDPKAGIFIRNGRIFLRLLSR